MVGVLEDLGEHRGAFVGLFVATGVAMLGLSILAPVLPLYADYLGASGLVLGVIFSGFAVSRGAFAPLAGRFTDTYGRKRLLLLGLSGYAVLSLAYAAVSTPFALGVVRFAQGFASVLVTPIAQSYVGDITPEGREGAVTNLFYVSFFGGIALGPALGGFLADQYTIRTPFYAMAGLTVFATLLVYLLVPELSAETRETSELPSFRAALRAVWADFELRGIMSYIAARGFYRWGFNSFFPVFAVGIAAVSQTTVGLLLSLYMAIGGVLQIPLGRLADSHRRYRIHFIGGGGLVSALVMLVIPAAHSLAPLVVLVVVMGVCSSVSRTSAIAIRTERGRVHGMGIVTGAFTAALSAGQVFGPVGFGAITDVVSIRSAFVVGGLVGLAGTLVSVYYLREGRRQSDAVVERAVEEGEMSPLD